MREGGNYLDNTMIFDRVHRPSAEDIIYSLVDLPRMCDNGKEHLGLFLWESL